MEVKTNTKTGKKDVKVQTNPLNIVKNTALDLTVDGVTGKLGSKVKNSVVKTTLTNSGRLNSSARAVMRATGNNVTRRSTRIVSTTVKATTKAAGKTTENATKAAVNKRVDAAKDNSNYNDKPFDFRP